MRKCRNWQTSKTKDLVSNALVWVQVPSSAVHGKPCRCRAFYYLRFIQWYVYTSTMSSTRNCWNNMYRKHGTKDLVSNAFVWVQVPSSSLKVNSWKSLFIRAFGYFILHKNQDILITLDYTFCHCWIWLLRRRYRFFVLTASEETESIFIKSWKLAVTIAVSSQKPAVSRGFLSAAPPA